MQQWPDIPWGENSILSGSPPQVQSLQEVNFGRQTWILQHSRPQDSSLGRRFHYFCYGIPTIVIDRKSAFQETWRSHFQGTLASEDY